jgi:hypothetical protein
LSVTIVENPCAVKCLIALGWIAWRYAASHVSEHVLDVGRKRWIGVDVVLELMRGDAELDRKSEGVDQLLAFMTDKMRAEDAIGRFVDDDLGPGRRLGMGFGRKPPSMSLT